MYLDKNEALRLTACVCAVKLSFLFSFVNLLASFHDTTIIEYSYYFKAYANLTVLPTSRSRRSRVSACDVTVSYFTFQPLLHDWCNKDRGVYYPVCNHAYKNTLLLIGKSSLCSDSSGFPLLLSEWDRSDDTSHHARMLYYGATYFPLFHRRRIQLNKLF